MTDNLERDDVNWKVWGYYLSIVLVTVLLLVIIYYCCIAKHIIKLIVRWRRRRRRVNPFPFGMASRTIAHCVDNTKNLTPLPFFYEEIPVEVVTKKSIATAKCPKKRVTFFEGPENTTSEPRIGKEVEGQKEGIQNSVGSPLSFLNNNLILNKNFRETVVGYMTASDEAEAGSTAYQPPLQVGIGTPSRVVIFSGIWSSFLGPTYNFLSSIMRSDPLGPEDPDAEPEDTEQEIQRLTAARSAGAVTILDFCQAEGSPHDRNKSRKSDPEPTMESRAMKLPPVLVEEMKPEPVVETKPSPMSQLETIQPIEEPASGNITDPPSSIYVPPRRDNPSIHTVPPEESADKCCGCC